MPTTHTRLLEGGLPLVELWYELVPCSSFFSWMQTCSTLSSMEMESGQRGV